MKVWNGSAWVERPAKVWSGTAWVAKPVKYWTGSAWVVTPAGGGPQVRVTFTAPADTVNGFGTTRCSIGIQAATYVSPHETENTPVELTFGGLSGFAAIDSSATITSDWVDLDISPTIGTVFSLTPAFEESGWDSYGMRNVIPVSGAALPVVVCIDILPSGGGNIAYDDGGSGAYTYYKASHTSTLPTPSGMTGPYGGTRIYAVSLIETQSV